MTWNWAVNQSLMQSSWVGFSVFSWCLFTVSNKFFFYIFYMYFWCSFLAISVSDPDSVGFAFNLGLDPGSVSVFGIRIRIPVLICRWCLKIFNDWQFCNFIKKITKYFILLYLNLRFQYKTNFCSKRTKIKSGHGRGVEFTVWCLF